MMLTKYQSRASNSSPSSKKPNPPTANAKPKSSPSDEQKPAFHHSNPE